MNKNQMRYEVIFSYGNVYITVYVIDEEGMNEEEIIMYAQVDMQKEGLGFDFEKLELVSCLLTR